ncbi:unnamed protein product [Absidia cylindrospora]
MSDLEITTLLINRIGTLIRQKYLSRAPGDAATKAYIASKYLAGQDDDKKRKKKKKLSSGHKVQQHGNIGIVDEDDWGWSNDTKADGNTKKRKKRLTAAMGVTVGSGPWQPIGQAKTDQGEEGYPVDEDDEEDKPVVVQDKRTALMTSSTTAEKGKSNQPRMTSGQKAGLLTSKEIQQEANRAKELEQRAMERLAAEAKQGGGEDGQDTIYRDDTGKKIDPKLAKAEEARKRKLEIERQERKMEWGKGLVQRNEQEQRRKQLEEETHKPLARYVDDDDYNQGLRDQDRWNDPAAGFLTKKSSSSSGKGKRTTRPMYKGSWKPNRYMIPPGYRWDGVDRSNGYEDQFLLHQNKKKSLATEAHAWSTEDM